MDKKLSKEDKVKCGKCGHEYDEKIKKEAEKKRKWLMKKGNLGPIAPDCPKCRERFEKRDF